jgi:predicted alpha/beta-hydrolase family hydrolase
MEDRPMSDPTPRLIDGSANAPATLLLAHGAGAPMDSPFMAAMATGLAERGWRVVRFEFPYMAHSRLTGQRRAPDRLPKLLEAFRQQRALAVAEVPDRPIFIGGKSLGGRVASLLADEHPAVRGCLCLGYPFHPPGRPEQLRTEHLQGLRTPTLILQGERDSFGKRGEVDTYPLSQAIAVEWITAGDHSFKPTRSSGCSEAGNWALAVELADHFLRQHAVKPG